MYSAYKKMMLSLVKEDAELVKVRLVINYCFYSFLIALVYVIYYLFIEFVEGMIILPVAAVLIILVPIIFRYTSSHVIVTNLFLTVAWGVIISIALFTGHIFSNILPWLSFIIITSVLLSNMRNASAWLVISLISIAYFYITERQFLNVSMNYNAEHYSTFYFAIGYSGLCALVYITSYLFQKEREKYIEEIQENSLILKNKNNELEEMKLDLIDKNSEIRRANASIKSQAEQINKINEYLEERILTRTEELEERNKQLKNYTYMISHQLRSPVCTILGLFNLLELPDNEMDHAEILKKLKTSVLELNDITKKVTNEVEV